MKFCIECGKKLPDTAKFCDSCGTKVGGSDLHVQESRDVDVAEVEALCMKIVDASSEGIHARKVTKDIVDVIRRAADRGVGIAAYVMSQFYDYGGFDIDGENVVRENADKMLEYLRIGAEAGDHFSQSKYGNDLCNGVDGSTDHEDGDDEAGFPWIAKAGKNGNVLALHRMTWAYLDGSYGQTPDLNKALECFKAIVAAKDMCAWKEEWIERAQGYLKFLPDIIDGDIGAMRKLGEWLKEREGGWEYSWGIGDASDESAYWLKKADDTDDMDEDGDDDADEAEEADDEDEADEADDEDEDEEAIEED